MNELQVVREPDMRMAAPFTANDIIGQVRLIQEVMAAVMRDKEHYGTIPGCGDKPTLLQPGAQKLLLTFRLAPEYEVTQTDQAKGHREYRVHCTLKSISSGNFCGTGVGCCSTMEGKYRFRVAPKKITDRPVPKEYWDLKVKDFKAAQAMLGGSGFSTKKDENGQWMIMEGSSEKVEHDNPADYYNTVLKMAKKRALVDATLTATAASDIFTQDIEDMPEVIPAAAKAQEAAEEPHHAPAPVQPRQESSEAPKAAPRPAPSHATAGNMTQAKGIMLESAKIIQSKPDAAKPWTLYVGGFTDGNSDLELSTFNAKLGDIMENLKGNKVDVSYKAGRKANTWELVSIEPTDDVGF